MFLNDLYYIHERRNEYEKTQGIYFFDFTKFTAGIFDFSIFLFFIYSY